MKTLFYALYETGAAILLFAAAAIFCAWRDGRRSARNPFTVSSVRFPDAKISQVDLRPGGITLYNARDQVSCTDLLIGRTSTHVGTGVQRLRD